MKMAAIVVFPAALLAVSCTRSGDSPPAREPDRVVGLLAKCEAVAGTNRLEFMGDFCRRSESQVTNRRLALTVRTAAGTTYTTEVAIDTPVKLGDLWPPASR
jgi:hypothetical protein